MEKQYYDWLQKKRKVMEYLNIPPDPRESELDPGRLTSENWKSVRKMIPIVEVMMKIPTRWVIDGHIRKCECGRILNWDHT